MPEQDYLIKTGSGNKWQRIGARKRAGILLPLFSVYSKKSIGIGDFSDLKLLIDWCAQSGNSILQLLPMNEVGSLFCPYDALSSFALEPAYISLKGMSSAKDNAIALEIKNLERLFLCGEGHVDYAIKKEKMRILRAVYLNWDHSDSADFKSFRQENSYWLEDFALYKVIKGRYAQSAWYEWEDKYRRRDALSLAGILKEESDKIDFYIWVQWQLYKQFKEAKAYAASKNILLKGDLPILVSRDSADVWAHPQFFKLGLAAGAPPDMYCAKGQRWGMPTYNWGAIFSDQFRYPKEKLKYAQNFYDTLRIDHVVGLFRIWSIPYNEPEENKGLSGFFDPQDEPLWLEHGKNILKSIMQSTDMLLCAEDLGVIPQVCTDTLAELGIPGNDVQRWTKDWKIKHDFLAPEEYRALSVAMLSTHDTTSWPAWWENEAGTVDEGLFLRKCNERNIDFIRVKAELFDMEYSGHGRLRWKKSIDSVDKLLWILGRRREELLDFVDLYENSFKEKEKLWQSLKLKGPMRERCDAEIMRAVLKINLNARSVFCINTIFDLLYPAGILKNDPYEYRINTPGTISDKNWSLTIPLPLEDLLKHKITKDIRKLVADVNR